jgi:hypothetical protein
VAGLTEDARGHETLKETSMQKYLIAGLLVAGMVSPAFAAEFYVAQSATTDKSLPRSRTASR